MILLWALLCGKEPRSLPFVCPSACTIFAALASFAVHARQYYPSDLNFVYDKISQSFAKKCVRIALGVPHQSWLTKKAMYCTCSGCVSISLSYVCHTCLICSACTAILCMHGAVVLLVYEKQVAAFIFCSWTVLIIRPQQYWFYRVGPDSPFALLSPVFGSKLPFEKGFLELAF